MTTMLKVLRTLCLGVVAAFSVAGFAQTNYTDKLLNPDMEKGLFGWDVTFQSDIWKKGSKSQVNSPGYHGVNNSIVEVWRYNAGPMTNNSISQTVKNLPNGTYVFGAYMLANNDERANIRETIEGVNMFANGDSVPVATNRVEGMDTVWAHTAKFTVATKVTDGTLKVGVNVKETNVNFTVMDNATLYYFGDMEPAAALDEMAKIDIAATIAIADTCLTHKMNVDTLAYLNSMIEAGKAMTSAADAYTTDENLYWGIRLAVKSIKAYNKLAEALALAKDVAAQEWSEDVEETVAALEALNALIATCDESYEACTALNAEVTKWADELKEAAALVALDSCYIIAEDYYAAIDELPLGDEVGQYTYADQEKAMIFYDEIMSILNAASTGEKSAITAMSECEALFAQIQQIFDNPIDYSQFPITINRSTTTKINKYYLLEGAVANSRNIATFTSPLYRFTEPLTKIRFTVKETGNNQVNNGSLYPFFSLGELELYDELGERIELTVENLYTNACHNTLNNASDGQGVPALIDGNYDTFFHSTYGAVKPNENHYIEVTLPEGQEYYGFSFVMTGRYYSDADINRQFPAVLDIRYVSDAINGLKDAIKEVDNINPLQGNAPGFYNTDVQVYYDAVAHAKELADADYASDSDIKEAIDALYASKKALDDNFVMPDPTKKYRVVSGYKDFFTLQGVMKAMTIHTTDTVHPNWLWWENASPEAVDQEFMFEAIPNDEGMPFYAMKHAKSGLYVCDDGSAYGNNNQIVFSLAERIDTFELRSLGCAQFAFVRDGNGSSMLHTLNHNSANPTTNKGIHEGSINGVTSSIIVWGGGLNNASSWYIREMMELPYAAKSLSDLNFQSESISLYEGINTFTLTADKECAFENLKFYDILHNELEPTNVKINANVAVVTLESNVETFSFAFTNAEAVATVTITGESNDISRVLTTLQTTYNQVHAIAPVEGEDVGQVSDLSEYNNALMNAEYLLENGGEEEAILAAKAALDSAKAHIVYNMPKEGVEYFILLGFDAFRTNFLTDMAVRANANSKLLWGYVAFNDPVCRWKFTDCGEVVNGLPAYYIENVGMGGYATRTLDNSYMFLANEAAEARPFNLFFIANGKVALGDTNWANGGQSIHPKGHSSGAGLYGDIITWGRTDAASAMRVVEAEKYITDFVYEVTDIEEIEAADEQVAPAVKGIYDLFGRRIEVPATTGIYIVDGKKQVVKK